MAQVEWLEQEQFPDPPEGEKQTADLVAKVTTLQPVPPIRVGEEETKTLIVHLEIEWRDALTDLRSRMPDYQKYLRGRYHVPVLSAALYLRVALQGQGIDSYEESFQGVRSLMEWPYVGLPGLDAATFVQGPNLLGVALSVLMRIAPERRIWLAAEALQRIATSQETSWRKTLLGKFVIAYGVTDDQQRQEFWTTIRQQRYREADMMTKTWFDDVADESRVRERRRLVRRLLESKFGPLSPAVVQRFEALSEERLDEIALLLLRVNTLDELGLGNVPLNGHNGT